MNMYPLTQQQLVQAMMIEFIKTGVDFGHDTPSKLVTAERTCKAMLEDTLYGMSVRTKRTFIRRTLNLHFQQVSLVGNMYRGSQECVTDILDLAEVEEWEGRE